MFKHSLALLAAISLSACDKAADILGPSNQTVSAKGVDSFGFTHEKHKLIITIGSVVAHADTGGYFAPYSVTTTQPFYFDHSLIISCRVLDDNGDLVGGAGLPIARAPEGGIFSLQLTRTISSGKLACDVADGEKFTKEVFPLRPGVQP